MFVLRLTRRAAVVVVLGSIAALQSFAIGGEPAFDAAVVRDVLRPFAEAARKEWGFPGAQIAVATPHGDVAVVAVGCEDLAGKKPLSPDALMLAGSTGKTFFAALALSAVAEKRFDLAAPIAKYLDAEPWFSRLHRADAMTIGMLMKHTSGIERYELDPRFLAALRKDPFHRFSIAERVEYVLDRDPAFEPGTGWTYSDTNFILLGAALEKQFERDLYVEIRKRFLDPLKLDHVVPATSKTIVGLAMGHAGSKDPFLEGDATLDAKGDFVIDPSFEWAGGGFATSAGDLARWCAALHGGDVLPRPLRDAMQDGVPCPLGRGVKYGLGAIAWPSTAGVAYGHSGFFPGYVSEMRYYPDLGLSIAIQINTSDFDHLRPFSGLLDHAIDAAHDAIEDGAK